MISEIQRRKIVQIKFCKKQIREYEHIIGKIKNQIKVLSYELEQLRLEKG